MVLGVNHESYDPDNHQHMTEARARKVENAAELIGQPDVDGALVGGAALTSDSFLGIITAVK